MPDLPDTNLCDHTFYYAGLFVVEEIEDLKYNNFFSIFVCEKCGKIQRVWEELK